MNPEAGESPAGVYGRHLESGGLGFQRCAGCGAAVFYQRVLCPVCGGVLSSQVTAVLGSESTL